MRYVRTIHARRARHSAAFTLIEAMLAQVIVGTAIVATCELMVSGTSANIGGTELTTAIRLAANIHEMTLGGPSAGPGIVAGGSARAPDRSMWHLDGQAFSPPLDAARMPLEGFDGWVQQVRVQRVNADDLASTDPFNPSVPAVRLTVSVLRHGRQIYCGSWLVASADMEKDVARSPLGTGASGSQNELCRELNSETRHASPTPAIEPDQPRLSLAPAVHEMPRPFPSGP